MQSNRLLLHLAVLIAASWIHETRVVAIFNPPITTVGAFRPVQSNSICGVNGLEDYCVYTASEVASLSPNCMRAQCNNMCPFSSTSPSPLDLVSLAGSFSAGVSATQGMPGRVGSAILFQGGSISVTTAQVPLISSSGFSFAAWINQDEGNSGALISKVLNSRGLNYAVLVDASSITFMYLPTAASSPVSYPVPSLDLDHRYWHHITVTVFAEDAAVYVNGSVVGATRLLGQIPDELNGDIKLGQLGDGTPYSGLMQDVYYYAQALTAREVVEVVNGSLPYLHFSTQCRCPPSHPLVRDPTTCSQHAMPNPIPRGTVGRLNSLSHTVGYVNDLSSSNSWVSSPGMRDVEITINLTQSLYDLFLINVRYNAPRPKAAVLETSKDGGQSFRPIQYYAEDCMHYFNMAENEPLSLTNLVNCISTESSQSPTVDASVQFRFVDPQLRTYDLDAPAARDFMLTSHLRLRLVDFFNQSTTLEHRYFAIQEIAIVARCACNGYAALCGSEIDSTCINCQNNTQGATCNMCLPTHNDKPWRAATVTNAFSCKLCQCNGHAFTCIYNASVDPSPDSDVLGGGGVCQDCDSNTAGVHCETCLFGYYRPLDRSPGDEFPCVPCDCDPNGIRDQGDCVKTSGSGGQIIGQCFCKANVVGLTCNQCRSGFSNLTAENPDGCGPCTCNTAGTFNGQDTCDSSDGQCLCKTNVMGAQCEVCRPNTTMLSASNSEGCSDCLCDPLGAVSGECDAITGQCTCRPGVTGLRCDQCLPGFAGMTSSGCVPCSCDLSGSHNNTCDPISGQCPCRPNVGGTTCNLCEAGFYDVSAGCVPCDCLAAGTVGSSTTACNRTSGQCVCKTNVEGRRCDTCRSGFTSILGSNEDGCSACNCFNPNTDFTGRVCDPVTSQCECASMATGLRCERCQNGSYLTGEGCVSCNCNVNGSVFSTCDQISGNCTCVSSVMGQMCDTCSPGFYNFPSCTSCGCDPAGTLPGNMCNPNNGTCYCKAFVTGPQCNQCVPGYLNLEASNPLGCSAVPNELAPPTTAALSSSSILLMWRPPEVPVDGFIQGYNVYVDGVLVATVTTLNYTRMGLNASTRYLFSIEAFNSAGSTRSDTVTVSTLEGIPTGVSPPVLTALSDTEISASWGEPTSPNGIITRYELVSVTLGPESVIVGEMLVFSGLNRNRVISGLLPFTLYSFIVRACTSGGCGSSGPSSVQTFQGPPTFQLMPNVSTLSSESLLVEWETPNEPNGIIVQYEVQQRGAPFQGDGMSITNTSRDVLLLIVDGLQPFTEYEFSIVSYTTGGGTASLWTRATTDEGSPGVVPAPVLEAVSSSEILVSWQEPGSPNGVIISYRVFQNSGLLTSATQPGSFMSASLQSFTEYFFYVEVCTSAGCSVSTNTSIFTLEAVPSGQLPPIINTTTSSSALLSWSPPFRPNGVISSFSVLRRSPSPVPSPLLRDIGVPFDGNVISQFQGADHDLGGASNQISLSFRTLSSRGTILYYINQPGTDFIALELRNGTPWFFFDAGTGPAIVQPELGGADVRFDDGRWHSISATHTRREGTIVVDGIYSGTGQSEGLDEVITSRQVLYIGGIPDNIPRSTQVGLMSPLSTLEAERFAGCIFGVTLNGRALDFNTGTTIGEIIADLPGCAVNLEPGFSLLGGGYVSLSANLISTSRFSWTLDYRTTHSEGLLFFVYNSNGSALGINIQNSSLYLVLHNKGITQRREIAGDNVCSGQWNTLLIDQSFNEVFLALNGNGGSLSLPSTEVVFSSSVFFGGVPSGTAAYDLAMAAGMSVTVPFSGCIRYRFPGLLVNGLQVPRESIQVAASRLRFVGCYTTAASTPSACSQPFTAIPAGTNQMLNDTGLQPFSAYLYAVSAANSVGTATSDWVATVTSQSAPAGVGVVTTVSRTSSSLTLSWDTPTQPNGLVTAYAVTLTPLTTFGLSVATGNATAVPLEVRIPEMVLLVVARGLAPATTYSAVLNASTSGGTGTGPTVQLATEESVPEDVQTPVVIGVGSRELTVTWGSPTTPNGVVVLYNLFVDGTILSSIAGNLNSTVVSGLQPFTEYALFLQACTGVGCSNGSSTVAQTLPDAPAGLEPPVLTVLSPSSIFARWRLPNNTNGLISRMELRRLTGPSSFIIEFVDSSLQLETTVTGLLPSTNYSFLVVAFNAGGSVSSEVVRALTLEDIPDQISPPIASDTGSTYILVAWSPPAVPNGDIILYNLTQDGRVIFSLMEGELTYNVTNLRSFSTYSFAVIACTLRGCGSSVQSNFMTLEALPEGYVQPVLRASTSSSITLALQPVTSPNGLVTYILRVSGANEGVSAASTVLFNRSIPAEVLVENLLPFTNYTFILEIENSVGRLTGAPFTILTASTVPEGLDSPTLSLLNATSVTVQWSSPSSPNGVILSYNLVVSTRTSTLTLDQGLALSTVLSDLSPFTLYLISVNVTNTEGSLVSAASNITTGETAPSGFDRTVVLETGPRHIVLSWDPPASSNGILINYTVTQDGVVLAATTPTSQSYNVTGLLPFTSYNFTVMVCTAVGCADSQVLAASTLEDAPEGLTPPFVSGGNRGQPVIIVITPPTSPNGIILSYTVERRGPDANVTVVGTLQGSALPLTVGDTSTQPFTSYAYRVLAENSAGTAITTFTTFLTPEAAPENVVPPTVRALSSTVAQISFVPPLSPRGNITMYTITRFTPSSSLTTPTSVFTFTPSTLLPISSNGDPPYTFNDTNLRPFTNYSYVLTVCNSADCTDSEASRVLTLEDTPIGFLAPSLRVDSSNEITVSWAEPGMPNGIIASYILLRLSHGFGRVSQDCCAAYMTNRSSLPVECLVASSFGAEVMAYQDGGLLPYSFYQYCLIVQNSVGSASSGQSEIVRTSPAPMPRAGVSINATTLNSTAIVVQWGVLDAADLLGPFSGYELYLRIAGTPGLGDVIFQGFDQSFTATSLLASTEYLFTVSISNGVGTAFSDNISAITEEGIPANLSAPAVVPVRSDALSISIREPLQPNGVIILYNVFLDGRLVRNATETGEVLLEGLRPFTHYMVQLEACTRFGCTRSPTVASQTLEAAPSGLASPFVSTIDSISVNISWSAPISPNGVIVEYRVLQTTPPDSAAVVVFSGLSFNTLVSDLRPFTTYRYQVFARNGAGNVTSIPTTNTTFPAPPTFIAPPTVSVRSSSEILVTWAPPEELNGVFEGYQLYRNGRPVLEQPVSSVIYLDTNLQPFTVYEYMVEVCSSGGCVNSSSEFNITLEALPEMVTDPVIVAVNPRSIDFVWVSPETPNGIITEYILTQVMPDSVEVFRGSADFSATASNLTPFTTYSFTLMVCNGAGCVTTNVVQSTTLETDPEQLDSPRLRNLTSTSVAIEWSPPRIENGPIRSYILRRGNDSFPGLSEVIFQGLNLSFNDRDLLADTLYSYTVTAVNGGGSITSNQSFYQTVPDLAEGIRPPNVTVQGANVIFVEWSPPDLANGDISAYRLFVNNNIEFSGLNFSFTFTNLQPFTSYSFFVEVCNQAGCASSTTVTERTEQAIPDGVTPPTLTALGPRLINVAWVAPVQPNGIVTQYQVQRRIPGDIFSLSVQHVGGPNILMFPNSGLTPFTWYEYRLRVTNGAGSIFSEWVMERTQEDFPSGLSIPVFAPSDIFARNVTATWTPPTDPNGIITSYLLEYRLAVDPVTLGAGEVLIGAAVPANVTVATIGGLQPVTSYEFRVVAINGAGRGESIFELVTTAEDIPEGIQEVIVEERTGFSLTLSWNQPTRPHGNIREYILFLDGAMVYRGTPPTTISRLTPFTSYSIQLAACTSAGCGFGILQYISTAATAPFGQSEPSVLVLEGGAVEVTWTPPLQPNGRIAEYQVLRLEDSIVSIVNITNDILVRRFVDTNVRPARTYAYAIRVVNSVGRTDSDFSNITTPEAAPEMVTPPSLTPLSAFAISVSWIPPTQPNGRIVGYEVFRTTNMTNVSVFAHPSERGFNDIDLLPFTEYSYTLLACTAAGCTFSLSATERTFEATPTSLAKPVLTAQSFSAISLSWGRPANPNGIIVMYNIAIIPSGINLTISGSETVLARNISNLQPFTNYAVIVQACNSAGCVSNTSSVQTFEHIPQVSAPPTVSVINATALNVMWVEPDPPNGIITRYELRRNGILVFNGTDTIFIDGSLNPRQAYSYTIQSYTRIGGSEQSRPSADVTTPSDTPQGVSPPSLTATGSNSVFATWSEPSSPNGVIQRYVLLQNGSSIHEMLGFQLGIIGLLPFTTYSYQLMACTTTCNASDVVFVTTLEAPPEDLPAPTLSEVAPRLVEIVWMPPATPNGIITRYAVERRGLTSSTGFAQIFEGSSLSYQDQDGILRPDRSYEYRITAFNGAGNVTSTNTQIKLAEAPPEAVPLPVVENITATSLGVLVIPPDVPNGILTAYQLLINGSQDQAITPPANIFSVTGLSPFTVYQYVVASCTAPGCTSSDAVTIRTGEAPPSGLAPPTASVVQGQSSVEVSWLPPEQANGIILSYSVWYRSACPQASQPNIISQPPCTPGPITLFMADISADTRSVILSSPAQLLHYTSYEFQVGVANGAGSINSSFMEPDIVTVTGSPVATGNVSLLLDNGVVSLNWSNTFQLNGIVSHYDLRRNGILLSRNLATSLTLTQEPLEQALLEYEVTVITEVGQASRTSPLRVSSSTPADTVSPATSSITTNFITTAPTELPFYRESPFIVGMVILAILLLFICLATFLCCIRPSGKTSLEKSQLGNTLNLNDLTSSKRSSPERAPVTGSWSPNEHTKGEIPDLDDPDEIFIPPKVKSYSPSRMGTLSSENRLSDIVIANPNTSSAKDDFGTFTRHQQQTFEDTRV